MNREEYLSNVKKEIFNKFKTVHNNEYEYEDYINVDEPFFAICKKHGKFKITANNHLRGNGKCSKCELEKQIIKIINDVRYYNCNIHGNIPIGLTRSLTQGCPKCNIEKQEDLNKNALLNRLNRNYGEKYNIIVNNTIIIFTCKKHHILKIVSRKEMRKNKNKIYFCDTCRLEKNIKKTKKTKKNNNIQKNLVDYDEAKKRVNELNIKSFREYKKWHIRTKQTEMPSNPHRVYKDRWISYFEFFGIDKNDIMSAGERKVYNYLQQKNIEFIWQKKFKDCKDKNTLPFDFYLPEHNLIVEFDGEQHYKVTGRFGKEGFEKTQKHDQIKNKYCTDNNINIIRLTYDDLNNSLIEWTLDNELNKRNKLSKIGREVAVLEL